LRGLPRVNAETAARVRAAAEAVGYRSNPLAGALMSQMRRSAGSSFRGVIAAVDFEDPDRSEPAKAYHAKLLAGAKLRSRQLGFNVERLVISDRGVTVRRLDGILRARGIRGLMLMPCWDEPIYQDLDWPSYAGVYADYFILHPPLHAVCPDHHRTMMEMLERLSGLGYQAPGLFLPVMHDARLQYRWGAAFLAFQHHDQSTRKVPPLMPRTGEVTEAEFRAWFRAHQPDVVIGHRTEVADWMRAEGARIPETHGLVCLNVLRATQPCAGIDLQPELIGRRCIETVVGQLQRNEFGIPETPSVIGVASRWLDGPTIRH
jgi:DNA-binding LacI/PurR family transcriptional regulator